MKRYAKEGYSLHAGIIDARAVDAPQAIVGFLVADEVSWEAHAAAKLELDLVVVLYGNKVFDAALRAAQRREAERFVDLYPVLLDPFVLARISCTTTVFFDASIGLDFHHNPQFIRFLRLCMLGTGPASMLAMKPNIKSRKITGKGSEFGAKTKCFTCKILLVPKTLGAVLYMLFWVAGALNAMLRVNLI